MIGAGCLFLLLILMVPLGWARMIEAPIPVDRSEADEEDEDKGEP